MPLKISIKKLISRYKNTLFNYKYRFAFRGVAKLHQGQLLKISEAYKAYDKINIYFIVNSLQAWKVDSLYWAMVKDELFEPLVVVVPSTVDAGKGAPKLYEHFNNNHYNVIKAFDDAGQPVDMLSCLNAGVYFYGDPYNNMDSSHFEKIIKNNIACYVPYFFMATNHVGGPSLIPNTSHINNMWRIYMPHATVSKIFSRHAARKGINAKIVGYPAVETIYKNNKEYKTNPVWKANSDKKKIIYAPHHSIGWGEKSLATFLQFAEQIKGLSEKHSNKVHWSFKPHPMLKTRLYAHPEWGQERTDAYYEFWDGQPYTQLDEGEYDDLFLNSDAIIHDCSSFIVEYAFTGKPGLYLINENNLKGLLNSFGQGVMQTYERGNNIDEIEAFIDGIVSNRIKTDVSKRAYLNDYIEAYYKHKLPSERIMEDIAQSVGALNE